MLDDRDDRAAGLEKFPHARPRIISDNGPQFIAKDFKQFIRLAGTTHVRTSPYYAQSNGKLERWQGTLKREKLRPAAPASADEARRLDVVDGARGHRPNCSVRGRRMVLGPTSAKRG
ncbi:MAG: hypothetical protein WD063_13140 [Pirellulales bacterium]